MIDACEMLLKCESSINSMVHLARSNFLPNAKPLLFPVDGCTLHESCNIGHQCQTVTCEILDACFARGALFKAHCIPHFLAQLTVTLLSNSPSYCDCSLQLHAATAMRLADVDVLLQSRVQFGSLRAEARGMCNRRPEQ